MKKVCFIIVCFCVFLSSCAGKCYVNESYPYTNSKAKKIALLPVVKELPYDADTVFYNVFRKKIGTFEIVKPSEIKQEMNGDKKINDAVIAVSSLEYELRSTMPAPRLKEDIKEEGFGSLRSACGDVDLLLVPSHFSMKSFGGLVTGKTKMRLYDMHTGTLIYEKALSLNVSPGGQARKGGLLSAMGKGTDVTKYEINEARLCTSLLAAEASSDFQTLYVDKIK